MDLYVRITHKKQVTRIIVTSHTRGHELLELFSRKCELHNLELDPIVHSSDHLQRSDSEERAAMRLLNLVL